MPSFFYMSQPTLVLFLTKSEIYSRQAPRDRARLAEKLLESLENRSNAENEILWAEEAERRDATWSSSVGGARTAKRVLRDARAKIR
jgi:Putative addiction module component